MLEVRLLGNFDIRRGNKILSIPSRPAQSLFAFLILNAGTAYRREKLAGQLWPDSTEEQARDYLRHALWRIRRAFQDASADNYLQADDLTIAFSGSSPYWLDTAALRKADEKGSIDQLAQALSRYAGELLPGFYDEWVVLERENLQAVYERKVGCLLELLQQAGRWPEVLEWAEKWIALGQKPEAAYRYLMSAYAAQGDLVRVATTFERCVRSLAEFGVEPSEQTRALYGDLKARKGSTQAQRKPSVAQSAGTASWNVPRPLNSFIGREREIAEVVRLLEAHRLTTLTGPGGVGKTRLAMQVADRMRDNFNDGVCWVELAPVADASLVPQAIASSLDVREAAGQSLTESLKAYLSSRKLLLILDNCEHLVLACAKITEILANSCPYLKILTTSREVLGIMGERVLDVPTLSLPPPQLPKLIDLLLEYESIRLFIERARSVRPDFELTEQNATAVYHICRRLDGIPLALELAAARSKLLAVENIAQRLNDRFSLLTQGSRTAIPRHQTLRATIDWSYDLLPDEARILFRRLSVFVGGFTLEAAEAVCSAAPVAPETVLDMLTRLVDRSLVKVERRAPEERYGLLESLREYAREKLRASDEYAGLRTRHLDYFLQLSERAEPKLKGAEQRAEFEVLDAELDNMRSAIDWAMEADPAKALRLTSALGHFYRVRGYSGEGRNTILQAMANTAEAPRDLRAKGLLYAGQLSIEQGDYGSANEMLQESLGLWRALGDQRRVATALNFLGWVNWSQGENTMARTVLEESLALFRQLDDHRELSSVLGNLGNVALAQSDYVTARRHGEESIVLLRESGDQVALAESYNNLGVVAEAQGDFAAAQRYYEESIAAADKFGAKNVKAYALNGLAHVYCMQGKPLRAKEHYRDSLAIFREIGEKRGIAYCLEGFATVTSRYEDTAHAARLLGAAEALRQAIGAPLNPAELEEIHQDVIAARGQLGEKAFNTALAQGRAMTLEQATAFALKLAQVE